MPDTARRILLPLSGVRRDLAPLTDICEDDADLQMAGVSSRAQQQIWSAAQAWYRTGTQPFISLCIRRRGHKVLHRSIGHSHGERSSDGAIDDHSAVIGSVKTPVNLFSASKAITAMLIHALAEDGLISLDETVAHYLPKFGQHGKQRITISQILSHQSGFPTMPDHLPDDILFDSAAVVEALMNARLGNNCFRPTAYHAISGGYILGEVVRQVTGKNVNQLLRERICKPLGLNTFAYGATPRNLKKVAKNYSTGRKVPFPLSVFVRRALGADWDTVVEMSNRPEFYRTIIPSGNVVGTSDELCLFMEVLRAGGTINGTKIFDSDTIRRAVAPSNTTWFDQTLKVPMRYSEGFMLGNYPVGMYGPGTQQAFGHLGFINIFGWADPKRELSVALLSTGKSLVGQHLADLMRLIWRINSCAR